MARDMVVLALAALLSLYVVAVDANRHPQYALLVHLNNFRIECIESFAYRLNIPQIKTATDEFKVQIDALRDSERATHKASWDLLDAYLKEQEERSIDFTKRFTNAWTRHPTMYNTRLLSARQAKATWDLHLYLFTRALSEQPSADLSKKLETLTAKVRVLLKSAAVNGDEIVRQVRDFRTACGSSRLELMDARFKDEYDQMMASSMARKDTVDYQAETTDASGPAPPTPTDKGGAPTPTKRATTPSAGSSSGSTATSTGSRPSADSPSGPESPFFSSSNSQASPTTSSGATTAPTSETSSQTNGSLQGSSSLRGGMTVSNTTSDAAPVNVTVIASLAASAFIVCISLVWIITRRQARKNALRDKLYDDDDDDATTESTMTTKYRGVLGEDSVWNDPAISSLRVPLETIEFGRVLARGGFGVVYVGRMVGQRVAIKQLLPERRKDMRHITNFGAEIKLMCTLEYVHIVRVLGVAWNSLADACVVTEYMSGGDLRTLLDRYEQKDHRAHGLDQGKLKIALDVAHALAYLHSLQPVVLHRDLKSKNVLLTHDYTQAKLTDFGVSRDLVDYTMTAGVGSSLWMAPEVILGKRYDEKADIFSFGVVLSEVDTQRLPYAEATSTTTEDGGSVAEGTILQRVATGQIQVAFSDTQDTALLALARACVAPNPDDRPTTAEVLYRIRQAWRRAGGSTSSS